jgi:hypothetical protein
MEVTKTTNLYLKTERQRLKNHLIENGIKADRLNSTGFGETKPIDTNKTAAGKATEELKFNKKRINFHLWKTPRFIGRFLFYEMMIHFFLDTKFWL